MVFLPHDNAYAQARAKAIIEEVIEARELFLFGWREVPINIRLLGRKGRLHPARASSRCSWRPARHDARRVRAPALPRPQRDREARGGRQDPALLHPVLFLAGDRLQGPAHLAVAARSSTTICRTRDYETALAVYHQRYSTNTFPTWPLSQPFRMLAHNGEINTRRGNVNWMRAREAELQADFWGEDIDLLKPIIQPGGSDSVGAR